MDKPFYKRVLLKLSGEALMESKNLEYHQMLSILMLDKLKR